ncbi:MAG TPA: OmpH family outer membrane protein [Vicinamibacterales bacterium]|nr:OmpH family outer membrane protein [Vicinamibacterales bacterium]
MRLKLMIPAAMAFVLAAASAFAQTGQPPAGQTPAQPQPPATQAPAKPAVPAQPPALKPPAPFPQDSKFAFVDINAVAANSSAGKEASNRLKALQDKKLAEINDKNKQLQAAQAKLNTGGAVLNDSARAQLEKDVDRMQRDIQFTQQNAQAEYNELQEDLRNEFQKKLMPIIDALATEKGLYAIFSVGDAGAMYVHPGLDLTAEVVKRLDGTPSTAK